MDDSKDTHLSSHFEKTVILSMNLYNFFGPNLVTITYLPKLVVKLIGNTVIHPINHGRYYQSLC